MSDNKSSASLSARSFRYVLLVGFFLLVVLIGVSFYFVATILQGYASETRKLNTEAAISDKNLAALRNIKDYLAAHQAEINRASSVVGSSKQYVYQNQIIDDINAFARSSGVTITSIDFSTTQAGNNTTTPSASTSPSTTPTPPTASPGAVNGSSKLKSTQASVTIKSPVAYTSLLNFIHRIEQNTTKMQIASVSLSKAEHASDVTTQAFQIEVYIK